MSFKLEHWHRLLDEARSYGLKLPRNCPTSDMVGGAVLDATLDWVDWYNGGESRITVLEAIEHVARVSDTPLYSEVALVAYVEFHRWKKERENDTLWFRPELLAEVENATKKLKACCYLLEPCIQEPMYYDLVSIRDTLEKIKDVLHGKNEKEVQGTLE